MITYVLHISHPSRSPSRSFSQDVLITEAFRWSFEIKNWTMLVNLDYNQLLRPSYCIEPGGDSLSISADIPFKVS